MNGMDDTDDVELSELANLKDFARGQAGKVLAQKLGLQTSAAPEEPDGDEPPPEDDASLKLEGTNISPELLAKVLEALKAQG